MTRVTYRAVIFDLDGVLWDGEPLYHEAFNVVLEPLGYRVSDEDYGQIMGHTVEYCWDWLRRRYKLQETAESLLEAYDAAVIHLLQRSMEPLPGVTSLLLKLKEKGVPLGLASASLRPWVDATLKGLGLDSSFQVVVSASEVDNGKPAPDIYLAAARSLAMPPATCIAVEDTATGVSAAKAAGMLAIQVRAASTALPPLPEADIVYESLGEFDLSLLNGTQT